MLPKQGMEGSLGPRAHEYLKTERIWWSVHPYLPVITPLRLFPGDTKEAEAEPKLECAQRGYFRKTVHKERQQLCVHAEGIESDTYLTHLNHFDFKSVLCD